MKVFRFNGSHIETAFAGPDLYRILRDVRVDVVTDEGTYKYTMRAGFLTDMRSGSHCIDSIIPKFTENNKYNLAILVHDFNYTKMSDGQHPVSKETADEMLRQMALLSGQIGSFKASLMKTAVKLFGGSAYEGKNDDRENRCQQFMHFRWEAK